MDFTLSLSIFWGIIAFFVVTFVGMCHSGFNALVLKMDKDKIGDVQSVKEFAYKYSKIVREADSIYDVKSYAVTVKFHPLYNILLWPVFALIYLNQLQPGNIWMAAFYAAIIWLTVSIVLDMFIWVIIKHPWRLTWKEFYIDYQPGLTITYIVIFSSPFIGVLLKMI